MKKLIVTAASLVVLSAAMAANADNNVNNVSGYSPVYVEVNGGLLHTGLKAAIQTKDVKDVADIKWKNGNYGYTVGGDLGYNATQHLGAEFGGYWMQGSSVTVPDSVVSGQGIASTKLAVGSRYMMYAAGTLRAQVATNLTVIAKAGMAYDHQKATITLSPSVGNLKTATGAAHDFAPMFAVEGQYSFGPNVYMTAQWTHVAHSDKALDHPKQGPTSQAQGNADAADVAALGITAKDLFTVGLGYRFNT